LEQTDRKSTLEVEEAIKQYPEIVKESAELEATLSPTQVSVERLFSALRVIGRTKELQGKKNSQKPSCFYSNLLNVHLRFKVINKIDIIRNIERNTEEE